MIRRFTWTLLSVLVLCCLTAVCRAEVDFYRLHGSDLGLGVGARAMAMGGAFSAVADDANAVYWNPAGLTQLDRHQLFVSADIPAGFNSAGLVLRSPFNILTQQRAAFGLSLVNRLTFSGDSGDDHWSGYSSHLLNLAMLDPGEDFSGSIRSRTYDIRLSLAFSPAILRSLSVGLNLAHID